MFPAALQQPSPAMSDEGSEACGRVRCARLAAVRIFRLVFVHGARPCRFAYFQPPTARLGLNQGVTCMVARLVRTPLFQLRRLETGYCWYAHHWTGSAQKLPARLPGRTLSFTVPTPLCPVMCSMHSGQSRGVLKGSTRRVPGSRCAVTAFRTSHLSSLLVPSGLARSTALGLRTQPLVFDFVGVPIRSSVARPRRATMSASAVVTYHRYGSGRAPAHRTVYVVGARSWRVTLHSSLTQRSKVQTFNQEIRCAVAHAAGGVRGTAAPGPVLTYGGFSFARPRHALRALPCRTTCLALVDPIHLLAACCRLQTRLLESRCASEASALIVIVARYGAPLAYCHGERHAALHP